MIVVDNSDNADCARTIANIVSAIPSATYISKGLNLSILGIAEAQNVGIEAAIDRGAGYLLFLDDDSRLRGAGIEILRSLLEDEKNLYPPPGRP